MKTIQIKSFDDYLSEISSFSEFPDIIGLFRGQSQKQPLLPSIARKDPTKDNVVLEEELINELKRRTAFKNSIHLKDNWDWLVYAQHFGLKTKLLDWTSNPLTAIWFACNNDYDNDAYVYVFIADKNMLLNKKENPNPFAIQETKIFRPPQNNERIVAQAGWFTAHAFSKRTNSFVPIEKNGKYKNLIYELVIPKILKTTIIQKCDLFGINNQTMFPDIEGICRQLNWENKL